MKGPRGPPKFIPLELVDEGIRDHDLLNLLECKILRPGLRGFVVGLHVCVHSP